jgi:glycosyltransferase involved in cell wall biosynthesis
MSRGRRSSESPHLIWIYNAPVAATLAATSRLAVTDGLREAGWRVTLVAEGERGRRSVRGVEVLCLPKPGVYLLGYCLFHLRLLALVAREWSSTDVVLFHQFSAPCLLPLRWIRRLVGGTGPLLVMDTRDVSGRPRNLRDRVRAAYYDLAHRLARAWADGQTAITLRMADWKQIPAEQLWGIWPSGVNVGDFELAAQTRQWPADREPICMVYVGTLLRERNLIPLCLAVGEANARQMLFSLDIVGDGPARLALEEVAHQTGGSVGVVPSVPHHRIPALLSRAHVGVVSLPDPEDKKFQVSSPIKLFEYMAAGLPILATRNVCYTDVVDLGGFAFWAEDPSVEALLAALCEVWRKRETLKKMGSRAAAAAPRWTWSESARGLDRSLRSGLARAQPARSRAGQYSD